ncbi:TVP38/TMEM64 family protein [Halobellus rubicundus]|uniref:TVP38/TMEM64 family protein n=1 Tax=Halobellus rubicundus TaxID=2996466 RepID=A0ABD5M667_9EURY
MRERLARLRTRLDSVRIFASPEDKRRFLVHLVAVAVVVAGLSFLARRHLALLTDAPALRAFIGQYGVWAPLVLIALQAVQVVAAPVPGQILAVVAGYLFGAWWGTLYNMIGITVGSAAAFWLSRRFGRAYVERIVHDDALATFDSVSDDYARVGLFVCFLVPGLPDDVICFAGGLTRLPLWQLVALAVVGRTPAFFLANVVGEFLGADRFGAAAAVAAVVLTLSAVGYLYRDRLVGRFRGEP